MSFILTDEQKDFQKLARDFGEREIAPITAEADRTSEVPMEVINKAIEQGFTTLTLDEKYGGLGLSNFTYALIKEELARADAGVSVTLGACALGVKPVTVGGDEKQIKRIADYLLDGGLTAFCLTEADAGSDAAALRTTAVADGDDYILNGTKSWITNGGLADVFTVIATTDRELGTAGTVAFIVDKNESPGIKIGKEEDKMGIRSSSTTDVIFDNVRVPKENMIGKVGDGFKIAMQTLDRTRPTAGAGALGVAQMAMEHAIAYSKERKTFGKTISRHQAVQFMLADMEIQIQAARSFTWRCADAIDHGVIDGKLFAAAKAFASDTAMKVTTDAVQVLGGFGYSKEYPVEKLMRDAKIYQIFEGTNQIQRMVVSGHLLRS